MARDERKTSECREEFSGDWGIYYPWFKQYNNAMKQWLCCIKEGRPETGNKEIPVIYSTPERAFSDLTRPRVEGQVDLPVIAFSLTSTSFEQARFKPTFLPFIKSQEGDKWRLQPRAMPWELNYNVSVFTKFYETLDIVGYALLSRFTPKSYLQVEGIASMISFQGHNDSSTLEPGANADRVLRHDYQFKVDGWMTMPYMEVGSIGNVIIDITDDINDQITDEEIANGQNINGVTIIYDFDTEIGVGAGTHKVPGVYTSEGITPQTFIDAVNTSGSLARPE